MKKPEQNIPSTVHLRRSEGGREVTVRLYNNGEKYKNYIVFWHDKQGRRQREKFSSPEQAEAKVDALFAEFFSEPALENDPARIPEGYHRIAVRFFNLAKRVGRDPDTFLSDLEWAFRRLKTIKGTLDAAIDLFVETAQKQHDVAPVKLADAVHKILQDVREPYLKAGKGIPQKDRLLISIGKRSARLIDSYGENVVTGDLIRVIRSYKKVKSFSAVRCYVYAMKRLFRELIERSFLSEHVTNPAVKLNEKAIWEAILKEKPHLKQDPSKSSTLAKVKDTYSVSEAHTCLRYFQSRVRTKTDSAKRNSSLELGYLAVLAIRIFTGIRITELYHLLRDDADYIDLESGSIHVPAHVAKNGAERWIYIWEVLASYLTPESLDAARKAAWETSDRGFSQALITRTKLTPGLKFRSNGKRHLAASAIYRLTKDRTYLTSNNGHEFSMYLSCYQRAITFDDSIRLFQCFADENDPRCEIDPRALFSEAMRREFPVLDVIPSPAATALNAISRIVISNPEESRVGVL